MLKNFKEFYELKGLVLKLRDELELGLVQELFFILSHLLEAKLPQFKEILSKNEQGGLIPCFARFWGDEDNENTF